MLDISIMITEDETITDALKKLNVSAEGVLLVVDMEQKLLGTLSDGDIRRAILAGKAFDSNLSGIFNATPYFLLDSYDNKEAETLFIKNKITLLPIVNNENRILRFLNWEEFFGKESIQEQVYESLSLSVVIMAGGKGLRMAPFTNVLPKPLIPIGEKTIAELIIDEFNNYGISNYYFTLNYKGKMIEAYFESIDKNYKTNYVWEDQFFGTAGSLLLLPKEQLGDEFFVSNCDIIVKADYADVYRHHKDTKADLTVLVSMQHHQIPYGVVEFREEGVITGLKEKPEFLFPVNTGVYLLKRSLLDLIPHESIFHMTHLIEKVIAVGGKVVSYPVKESDYIDIGQWKEYRSALKIMEDI